MHKYFCIQIECFKLFSIVWEQHHSEDQTNLLLASDLCHKLLKEKLNGQNNYNIYISGLDVNKKWTYEVGEELCAD